MLKIIATTLKLIVIALCAVILTLVAVTATWYHTADMRQPVVSVDTLDWPVNARRNHIETRGNRLRQSNSGLWEIWLTGAPLDRGVALGRMSGHLLHFQEKVFVDQIRRLVPSERQLGLLRYLLIGFNRNLGSNVAEEYRREIYGVSLSCSHEFDAIGTPYERQLNYHAAHDIGHTMQEYMLVGCSSFAAWGDRSADGQLVVGRNFDFWVGNDFAQNRVVAFYNPDDGHAFASITWPGMIGVLSGMNERGLTVTINAAKGAPPTSSATPISIVAREILQYASTIDEALAIARSRKTFVSESLLVSSAADGRAAIIEKSPSKTVLLEAGAGKEYVICTNHFQSPEFADDKQSARSGTTGDSPWRYKRLEELIAGSAVSGASNAATRTAPKIGPARAAAILRDSLAVSGATLPANDARRIRQEFAHHSVIFRPEARLMWVSTKMGHGSQYVCYDLRRIFATAGGPDFAREIRTESLTIPAEK